MAAARTTTTVGGALLALAGLLITAALLGPGDLPALPMLASVAQAAACLLLATGLRGEGGITRGSVAGAAALIVFGRLPLVAGLLLTLPIEAAPPVSVAVGMTALTLVTVAAVEIARAGVLRGFARWAFLLLAAEAALEAVMSTVATLALLDLFSTLHLELVRPIALVVCGVAYVLAGQGEVIRRRLATFDDAWKRSTDVGGAAGPERTPSRGR